MSEALVWPTDPPPQLDDTFTSPNGVVWRYDGVKWRAAAHGTLDAGITVSQEAPTNVRPGRLWFDSEDLQTYLRYRDPGDSEQWVPVINQNLHSDFWRALNEFKDDMLHRLVPAGSVFYFPLSLPPLGYLHCDGSAVLRDEYADLYEVIGTYFGAGNGSTTFNLPDLRGEFIRCWAGARGVDTGRVLRSFQDYAQRQITGTIYHNWTTFGSASGAFALGGGGSTIAGAASPSGSASVSLDSARQVPTAGEVRPRNVALLACIKW